MYILFFLFWVMLNGRLTLEIAIFGIVIAAALYAFMCHFTGFSVEKDIFIVKKIPLIIVYIFVLVMEIIKANIAMAGYILQPRILNEPALVRFRTDLRTHTAQVVLANSITMTPGTITVELIDGEYMVHCYDKSIGEDLDESVFVKWLRRLEA